MEIKFKYFSWNLLLGILLLVACSKEVIRKRTQTSADIPPFSLTQIDVQFRVAGTDFHAIPSNQYLIDNWLAGTNLTNLKPDSFSTSYFLTSGWATFGVVVPKGQANSLLQVADLETQTDVKTRWDDGSIRFAVVTSKIPQDGNYEIHGTSEELDHPLVVEQRFRVVPVDPSNNGHPFLAVIFDIRNYIDGAQRIDIVAENVLNKTGGATINYDIAININGNTVFQKSAVSHYYLARWRKVFEVNLNQSQITPNLESFYGANALPRYLSVVSNTSIEPTGTSYDLLGGGALNPYMGAPGGRPEIAPYPDWTARYLVHKAQTQRNFVLKNGDLAASWPVHLQELDQSLVSIDQKPYFWLDWRANPGYGPLGNVKSTGPLAPDAAHQPSIVYVPYLMTGDRFYVDEIKYWNNYILTSTWEEGPGSTRLTRGGSQGLLQVNQVRGIAWALRNLADGTAYLPDNDPMKAYFTNKIQNNLAWLDNYAVTNVTPLGSSFEGKRPENSTSGYIVVALWEQNYLAWAIDHANKQGFTGGLLERDKIVHFQLSLFTSPDYPKEYAMPYTLWLGTRPANAAPIFYTSLADVYWATYGSTSRPPAPIKGYYGIDARLSLMIAIENGFAGAAAAYDWLNPQLETEIYLYGLSDLANRAGWALSKN